MKKRIYSILIFALFSTIVWAQSPEKMSYQAVVRDASNALVSNQTVGVQISILQASVDGSSVFVERHTLETNPNGLLSLEIGDGAVIAGIFADIDWANGPYFIKVETDPNGGTNYTITGVSQLLSVPYAMHATTAENVENISISGSEDAFDAWDKNEADDFDGQYSSLSGKPTNVSSFTNDAGYLSSFTEVDGSVSNELQTLSVSGNELSISDGNTVSIQSGAQAINDLSDAKTTGNTLYLGIDAGASSSGQFSVGLGKETLNIATGNGNTALGYKSLRTNSTGDYNTAVGDIALGSNTSGNNNTAIGTSAGYENTSGNGNVFVGYNAGRNETESNKLYIENSSSDKPLIGGDFANDVVTINGKLGISKDSPVQGSDVLNLHFDSAPSSGNAQFIEAGVGSEVNFKVNHTGAIYTAGGIDSNGDINAYADISVFGNVKTDLNLEEDITVKGRVLGKEDANADMKAFAYGYIEYDGDIFADQSSGGFEIRRIGVGSYRVVYDNYIASDRDFILMVTPDDNTRDYTPKIAVISDWSLVLIFDINGNRIDSGFYLLIFRK